MDGFCVNDGLAATLVVLLGSILLGLGLGGSSYCGPFHLSPWSAVSIQCWEGLKIYQFVIHYTL